MALVKVEELEKELAKLIKRRGVTGWMETAFDAQDIECLIKETPFVDAVEIVRCKDCKEYMPWLKGNICGRLGSYYGYTKPDDFCSKGIRKNDASD